MQSHQAQILFEQIGAKSGSALKQIADVQVRKAGKKARRVFKVAEPEAKVEDEETDAASERTEDTCDLSSTTQEDFAEQVKAEEEPKLQLIGKPFVPEVTVEQVQYQAAYLDCLLWTVRSNLLRFQAFQEEHQKKVEAFRQAQAERYLQKTLGARRLLEARAGPTHRVAASYLRSQVQDSIREAVALIAPAGRAEWITSMIGTLSPENLREVLSSYECLEARVHEAASMIEDLNADYLAETEQVYAAVSAGTTVYHVGDRVRFVKVDVKQAIKAAVSELLDEPRDKRRVLGVLANLPSDQILNFLSSVDALRVAVQKAARSLKED